MEYIVENTKDKTFLKINKTFSAGLPFLKIFESESDATDFVKDELPADPNLEVIEYKGFQA